MAIRFDQIQLSDDGNHLYPYIAGTDGYLAIQTASGLTRIGAGNSSYSHFFTDRSNYYFNAAVSFDGNISAYDGNENLSNWNNIDASAFRSKADTNYYLDPDNTGTSLKAAGTVHASNSNMSSYQLNGTYVMDSSRNLVNIVGITSTGNAVFGNSNTDKVVVHGHLGIGDDAYPKIAYPGQNALWSGQGSTTGQIVIDLPGTLSNYDMMYMEIDVYEYSSDHATKIIVGGHNWNSGGNSNTSTTMWYNAGVRVIGSMSKPIYLGRRNDGSNERRCIAIGETTSTWSYATVHVHKVHGAEFYSTAIDWVGDWNIAQTTSTSYFTKNPTTNFNLNSSTTLRTNGRFYAQYVQAATEMIAPIFYDSGDTNYYVNPAGDSQMNQIHLADYVRHLGDLDSYFGFNGLDQWKLHLGGGDRVIANTSTLTSNLNFQAPIFYDSNDTNYYLDPESSTTSLYANGKLYVNGGHSTGRLQINYQHGSTPSTDSNSTTLTAWASEPGITYNGAGIGANIHVSGQYYGRAYDTGYGVYTRFDKANGRLEHWTTQGNSGTSGGQGTRQWYNDASGNSFATTSSRAPIFRDSNDTNYYLDAATSSIALKINGIIDQSFEQTDLNTAWTTPGSSFAQGFIVGRYQSTASNIPSNNDNANWFMNIYSHSTGGTASYGIQLAGSNASSGENALSLRNVSNGSFSAWRKLYHEGHKPTYSELGTMAYSNLTGTPTIPTDFVSASSGGTFSGNIVIGGNSAAAPRLFFNKAASGTAEIKFNNVGSEKASIQLDSAEDLHIFANTSQKIKLRSGGADALTLETNQEVKVHENISAPIYYDLNNSAYYVNPASTSKTSVNIIDGRLTIGQSTDAGSTYRLYSAAGGQVYLGGHTNASSITMSGTLSVTGHYANVGNLDIVSVGNSPIDSGTGGGTGSGSGKLLGYNQLNGSERATATLGVNNFGIVMEYEKIFTFKVTGSGWLNRAACPYKLIQAPGADKIIVVDEFSVYIDYETRTGISFNGVARPSDTNAYVVGFYKNETGQSTHNSTVLNPNTNSDTAFGITMSGNTFYTLGVMPRDFMANSTYDRGYYRDVPVHQSALIPNRSLFWKTARNCTTTSNAPGGAHYIKIKYRVIDISAEFSDNGVNHIIDKTGVRGSGSYDGQFAHLPDLTKNYNDAGSAVQ